MDKSSSPSMSTWAVMLKASTMYTVSLSSAVLVPSITTLPRLPHSLQVVLMEENSALDSNLSHVMVKSDMGLPECQPLLFECEPVGDHQRASSSRSKVIRYWYNCLNGVSLLH